MINSLRLSDTYMHKTTTLAQCQAIILTNDGILQIGPLEMNLSAFFFYQNQHILIQENAFENGVLKMVTVSSWAQWVNAVSQ